MQRKAEVARSSTPVDAKRRVVDAFKTIPLKEYERRVVQALLDLPGRTSEALTLSLGWKRLAWQLHFGTICHKRRPLLWDGPDEPKRSGEFYCGILADFDEGTRGFTMKPEAVDGFMALGLRTARRR